MLVFITRIRPTLLFSTGEGDTGGGTEGPAPTEAPETATADTSQETGTTTADQQHADQINWEERYKEAQGWGTRNAQRVSELEPIAQRLEAAKSGDREALAHLLGEFGLQLQEDDDTEDDDGQLSTEATAQIDPALLARIEAFEAYVAEQRQAQQQQTAQQQQQAQYEVYRENVDPRIKRLGVPDGLVDAVAEAALNRNILQTPHGPQADLEGAWGEIKKFLSLGVEVPDVRNAALEAYKKTKQTPRVASGGAGTQVPSLDTSNGRVAHMMDRLAQQEG